MGLAGSVFFSLDFDSARWRVALYLVLTIAPFAVAAPLIGPALDRIKGGRRWIIVGSMGLRALLCVLVVMHLDSLLFYPEAFGMLVLAKVYTISKSAVVPGTVRSDTELVEANSKLTVLSALAVVVAVVPGGILLGLGGAQWALGLAAIVFTVATVLAFKLPPTTVATEPEGEAEREELRSAGIFLAGTSMAVIRGIVGFLSFMLAFAFKNAGAPLWQLGVVAATAQLGFFMGAVVAPRLRRLLTEERILVGALVVTTVGGVFDRVHRRPARCVDPVDGGGRHGELGQAGLRLDRAARRSRRQPGSVLRPVRDALPADLGDRRARSPSSSPFPLRWGSP